MMQIIIERLDRSQKSVEWTRFGLVAAKTDIRRFEFRVSSFKVRVPLQPRNQKFATAKES
jgi:hypothetical protein